MTLGVAVAQFSPVADEAANLARIDELAGVAADRGGRVVVFPEYSSYFVDPFDESLVEHAQGVDGAFVEALRGMAVRRGQVLVAGLLEREGEGRGEGEGGQAAGEGVGGQAADEGCGAGQRGQVAEEPEGEVRRRVCNTVVAVGPDGLLATYRKVHLYDAFGQRESDRVEPGELTAPETFELDGLVFGLATCYDLRFPESTRVLADAGVTAVLVPAQWVRGPLKEHHWETLIAARAIENTCYVAAADHSPKFGIGLSRVVDPQGVVVAGLGVVDGVAVGFLDPAEVARVRKVNPALELRRYRVVPR